MANRIVLTTSTPLIGPQPTKSHKWLLSECKETWTCCFYRVNCCMDVISTELAVLHHLEITGIPGSKSLLCLFVVVFVFRETSFCLFYYVVLRKWLLCPAKDCCALKMVVVFQRGHWFVLLKFCKREPTQREVNVNFKCVLALRVTAPSHQNCVALFIAVLTQRFFQSSNFWFIAS